MLIVVVVMIAISMGGGSDAFDSIIEMTGMVVMIQ